jgi:hypothetical protein
MSTKLTVFLAATTLIIGTASSALAEDVSRSDLSMTVPTGPSAQTFETRSPRSLTPYYTGAPQTEDFIDRRTGY